MEALSAVQMVAVGARVSWNMWAPNRANAALGAAPPALHETTSGDGKDLCRSRVRRGPARDIYQVLRRADGGFTVLHHGCCDARSFLDVYYRHGLCVYSQRKGSAASAMD